MELSSACRLLKRLSETVAKGVIPFNPFFGAEKDYLQVL